MPSVGLRILGVVRSKIRNSQKALVLAPTPFALSILFPLTAEMKNQMRCRLIAHRETYVEIETHENL
jgi:hypothetical protein